MQEVRASGGWLEHVRQFRRLHSGSLDPAREDDHKEAAIEIGVIGQAAAGKSALINALIAPGRQVLPSGGVGPLTGAPTRIRYSYRPVLRVRYRGRAWLHDALRTIRDARGRLSDADLGRLLLVCTGDQYGMRDPGWLEAAIRYAFHPDVGRPPDETSATSASLKRLHEMLKHGADEVVWEDDGDGNFFRVVREHMAGQMAPLCAAIDLGWPSPVLREGVILVDLPGLGTSHDSHVDQTNAWLADGQAVLLVTDRAGVPDSVASSFRRTGFLGRFLHGGADMIGVVTKLDQIADDARRREVVAEQWSKYFRDAVARAETLLSAQLEAILGREPGRESLGPWVAHVAKCVGVRGVSSREHHRLIQNDQDEPARLTTEESTGIPAVRRELIALARLRSFSWTSRLLDETRRRSDGGVLYRQLIDLAEME